MSLISEVKNDLRLARKYHLPPWAIASIVIGTVLGGSLLDHFGRLDLAGPTFNSILVLGFVMFLKRRLWRNWWFWLTIAILAGLIVLLLLYVPWGVGWVPSLVIAGMDTIGLLAILWVIALVEKFAEKPS